MKYPTALALAFATIVLRPVYGAEIVYDCEQIPNICMNFCWAVYCQGLMVPLHGGKNINADDNRKAIGTDSNSKAINDGLEFKTFVPLGATTASDANSPDEYPLASSNEGGLNALNNSPIGPAIRMATQGEQSTQGGASSGIGSDPPTVEYDFRLINYEKLDVDWCNALDGKTSQCKNDGNQYTMQKNKQGQWDKTLPYIKAKAFRKKRSDEELLPVVFEA